MTRYHIVLVITIVVCLEPVRKRWVFPRSQPFSPSEGLTGWWTIEGWSAGADLLRGNNLGTARILYVLRAYSTPMQFCTEACRQHC
jgi:hypothetical protein